jgi:TonB family protein
MSIFAKSFSYSKRQVMEGKEFLLLEYIIEKELEEKKRRRRKALIGLVAALVISGAILYALPQYLTSHKVAQTESQSLPAIPTVALSQQDGSLYPEEIDKEGPFVNVDVMPHFPGGELALYRFLSRQIRYPAEASRKRIEGKVIVRFVIEKDGTISQPVVVKGIGHGCDEEAIRIIQKMPRWQPGQKDQQVVSVYSSLAVNFKFL